MMDQQRGRVIRHFKERQQHVQVPVVSSKIEKSLLSLLLRNIAKMLFIEKKKLPSGNLFTSVIFISFMKKIPVFHNHSNV